MLTQNAVREILTSAQRLTIVQQADLAADIEDCQFNRKNTGLAVTALDIEEMVTKILNK